VDARGQDLTLDGDPQDVATVERIMEDFAELFREGKSFTDRELREAFAQIAEDRAYSLRDYFTKARFNPAGKKQVAPKSANQRRYIEAIQNNDIVFSIGPAGTGKSYLAVAMAVQALTQKQVSRIILARPAVEAGERLGFLPGDLQEKVDPYLRPLYDALFDLMDAERVAKMLEKRIIEVAPLAFMRGRTLGDAFIILDEAQNTTSEQMKMALTRIGFGSKAVITGDVTQIDLPTGKRSGLVEAERILSKVEGIEFVYFTDKDVVRHRLVQQIIKAYESQTNKSDI
jgi:phosphate starvation-inducible PhoH-like protein